MTVPTASRSFDAGVTAYEETVALTLTPVARRVVEAAALQPGESVLDVGTGTGTAAAFAVGGGRRVVGIDGAPAMVEKARGNVPGATFEVMDFEHLTFADDTFDAVVASHSLLFAADRVAALREWRRVTRPGGRLSLSVPGPEDLTPTVIYRDVYERHGISTGGRYPDVEHLGPDAEAAGWVDPRVAADPMIAIRLRDEKVFRTWRDLGMRGEATRDWTPEQHEALTREMLAATPRDADGAYVMPFGAIFLSARKADLGQ